MKDICTKYEWISAMHEKNIASFEKNENSRDSKYLIKLLNEWRSYLKNTEVSGAIITKDKLYDIEAVFHEAYSPIILSQKYIISTKNDIVKFLLSHKNEEIIQQDNALLICRLLFNCCLLEDCFYPLLNREYENHITKVLCKLNICIIISQSDYFSEYFNNLILDFNSEFASIKETSAHIFHVVGVLNFKCHNYKLVIEFFNQAINRFETELRIDCYKNDEYFQTRLLLAYCYEYDHQFENAIRELVGLDIDALVNIFKESNFGMFDIFEEADIERTKIWSENFIFKTLKNRILEGNANSLFEVANKRDFKKNNIIGDVHEVLHSLAHCLNELGIKWRGENGENQENTIYLLSLSRAIMLYVAELDPDCFDFQTCLYMIFGEAKDYDICLKRIDGLMEKYRGSVRKNINYEMENMFYLFLISNQSNKVIFNNAIKERADEAYYKYVDYAKRRYDYDALIHIEIFRFRFEIVQVLYSSVNNSEIEEKLISLKGKSVGKNVFSIKPSVKANKWIIQEYNKTIALYEFLVKYFADEESVNINELFNFASRFMFFRKFFSNNKSHLDKENMDSVISEVIELIIDDFISPQSIFILAPLTSALPYQHQTKNLNVLENSLFTLNKKNINVDEKMEYFSNLNNINFGTPNNKILNWLFKHKEYGIAFVAFKHDSDEIFDRYYLCLKEKEIFERPILNVKKLNKLMSYVHKDNKRHSLCKNKQVKCCTTIVNNHNKSKIVDICSELMIPFEKYNNKHFIFFYKGTSAGNRNHTWYIIALNDVLNELQKEEIILQLCGHNLQPNIKLAVSNCKYCFVSFGKGDYSLATNDLLLLQEKYEFRFWYDIENFDEEFNKSVNWKLTNAQCAMFFISSRTNLTEKSRMYKEILLSIDNEKKAIFILIGFGNKEGFEIFLNEKIGRISKYKEILSYLNDDSNICIFREQREYSFTQHILDNNVLSSKLKEFEVLRDD